VPDSKVDLSIVLADVATGILAGSFSGLLLESGLSSGSFLLESGSAWTPGGFSVLVPDSKVDLSIVLADVATSILAPAFSVLVPNSKVDLSIVLADVATGILAPAFSVLVPDSKVDLSIVLADVATGILAPAFSGGLALFAFSGLLDCAAGLALLSGLADGFLSLPAGRAPGRFPLASSFTGVVFDLALAGLAGDFLAGLAPVAGAGTVLGALAGFSCLGASTGADGGIVSK